MATDAYEIRRGMEVFASDGQKLGTVGDFLSGAARTPHSEGTSFSSTGGGQPSAPAGSEADAGSDEGANAPTSPSSARMPETAGLGSQNTGTETTGFAGGSPGAIGVGASEIGFEGTGGVTLTPSDTKYFEVKHGGFLGLGGDTLYVPFNAIESISAGESVTLSCRLEECTSLYAEKPAPLAGESDGGHG